MDGTGKVWLAGAGPGDAGLLTVRTRELIEAADIIVYDALISAEILSLIPPGKEVVNVGKRSGHHLVPQHEINEILLKEAQKGRKVLRLKGGDPFVFGRGGEELELLAEHRIPFEIVPGITSATAVPAYAGIPVTHRTYASSLHIITGHPRQGGTDTIDYASLVKMKGTLVFLMGITSMETILNGLMDAGLDRDTPAAVIENGTLFGQCRVISVVDRLAEDAGKAGIRPPAVIIVGDVCALSDRFHWTEDRPLGGRQILVTRPRQSSSVLAGKLRTLGAQVIELPSIATRAISPNTALQRAIKQFGNRAAQEWLLFTSPAGVRIFFEQLAEFKMDIRHILCGSAQVKVGAIGSATERELKGYGLLADVVPDVYCAARLGEAVAAQAKPGSKVTVARALYGSEELLPPLLQAGLDVDDIPLYETVYETHEQVKDKIVTLFEQGGIDAVTFTSASTVKGFIHTMERLDYHKIRAICIGEQTAAEAEKYRMDISVAKEASIESMTECILDNLGIRGR